MSWYNNKIFVTALYGYILSLLLLLSGGTAGIAYAMDEENILRDFIWHEVTTLPVEQRIKVGLTLGGGGARGLAHIGVLKVFEQENVPVDIVTGTSVGSLAGALYSSGYPIEKLERMADDIGWTNLTNIGPSTVVELLLGQRLLSTKRMEIFLQQHIGDKTFDELNKKFACVATDLQTGERIIFREGKVAIATRASATIPGVFQPVNYRHRMLIDGGIVNNLPTDIARALGADVVIAVSVEGDFSKNNVNNVLLVLNQSISIQGGLLLQQQMSYADVVLIPNVGDVTMVELWRGKECIESGMRAAREMMPKVKAVIMDRTFKKELVR
ncbi:MAG: patatin-like phospholipase family protein [Elusimicrobiota bacterium]